MNESDDEDGGGESYEESFESFSSPTKKSPQKEMQVASERDEDEDGDGDGEVVEGMDLATFMGNYKVTIENSGDPNKEDPSMRPLDGVSPNKNEAHKALEERFGNVTTSSSPDRAIRASSGSGLSPQRYLEGKNRLRSPVVSSGNNDNDESEYQDEAAALLAKIRSGSLGTGMRGYEKDNCPLKAKKKNLSFEEQQQDADDHGALDEEKLSYYTSLANYDVNETTTKQKGKKPKNVVVRDNSIRSDSAEDRNSKRVDALLSELLPNRNVKNAAIKTQKNVADKKSKTTSAKASGHTLASLKQRHQEMEKGIDPGRGPGGPGGPGGAGGAAPNERKEYGLNNPNYFGNMKEQSQTNSAKLQPDMGGSQQQSYTSQIAQLRKELKHRDERLQRVTEHSLSLASQTENQKAENASLKQRLNQMELDLEAKEQRALDAMRLRKKAQKKFNRLESEMKETNSYVKDNERLRDREQALIEAVEALSSQNEDLITKLKASMARELELSQLADQNENDNYPRSPPRAQSDTRLQRKGRSKKGGRNNDDENNLPKLQTRYR